MFLNIDISTHIYRKLNLDKYHKIHHDFLKIIYLKLDVQKSIWMLTGVKLHHHLVAA